MASSEATSKQTPRGRWLVGAHMPGLLWQRFPGNVAQTTMVAPFIARSAPFGVHDRNVGYSRIDVGVTFFAVSTMTVSRPSVDPRCHHRRYSGQDFTLGRNVPLRRLTSGNLEAPSTSQCSGISPSHSTPESLYSGYRRNRRGRAIWIRSMTSVIVLRLPSQPEPPAARAHRWARLG